MKSLIASVIFVIFFITLVMSEQKNAEISQNDQEDREEIKEAGIELKTARKNEKTKEPKTLRPTILRPTTQSLTELSNHPKLENDARMRRYSNTGHPILQHDYHVNPHKDKVGLGFAAIWNVDYDDDEEGDNGAGGYQNDPFQNDHDTIRDDLSVNVSFKQNREFSEKVNKVKEKLQKLKSSLKFGSENDDDER